VIGCKIAESRENIFEIKHCREVTERGHNPCCRLSKKDRSREQLSSRVAYVSATKHLIEE